ncbi:MogA/MoaB family molybdenum cofactor biosynthesis protein [Halobellus ordinarius]|uniref:MogA/MoaB family molybdenum cofactor biosynthesis protein n=1 Tax=Halobellus ordinarius TaxID=3075120 RepID=UPI002880855D|nr:molybdopterin-binding protein [Halobellus sp. ZY16]
MTEDDQSHEESHGDAHDHDQGNDDHHGHAHDHGGDEHHHTHDGHGHDHDHHAHDVESVGAAIVTVSTSRTLDDDSAGDAIAAAFEAADHEVATREVVPDDFDGLQSTVDGLVDREAVDVVVTTGGTGVTPDDVTIEAVSGLFEKELPGFGELFRRYSEDEIGTRVVGTRATAGILQGVPLFCLPGSENAARLGSEELIVPEAPHLAGLATRPEE